MTDESENTIRIFWEDERGFRNVKHARTRAAAEAVLGDLATRGIRASAFWRGRLWGLALHDRDTGWAWWLRETPGLGDGVGESEQGKPEEIE